MGGTHHAETTTAVLPAVTAGQNGPGSAVSLTWVVNTDGQVVWAKDAAGFLTHYQYDANSGGLTKAVFDVNATTPYDFSGLPSGWSTPVGGGLHQLSRYEVDAFGRTTKATDPNGRVTYTVYKDADHEVRTYRGWDGSQPTGPIEVYREDWARGYTEWLTMSTYATVIGGLPVGTESVSGVQSLTRAHTNTAGQMIGVDAYVTLSGAAYSQTATLGTAGVNYLHTDYGYDKRGWSNKEVGPDGVIQRTVYDALGRPVSAWVGTNDTPVSGFWSPSNPAGMTQLVALEYDGGGVGDSNPTATTVYPGHGRAARTTATAYDWRNRPVAVKEAVEGTESESVNRPLTRYIYDNLGQVVTAYVYDGDTVGVGATPAASRLRAYTAFSYDEYGRVYSTASYGVNQTTGVLASTPLIEQVWYDLRGLVAKTQSADGQVMKWQYDGLGRATAAFLTDGAGDATWTDAMGVADDTVWAQSETVYDIASQVLQVTSRERVYGETGAGPLGTPTAGVKARVTYAGWYYDLLGRTTNAVTVGTNSGTAWVRPSSVPARSNSTLVTSVSYGANGLAQDVTDPRGIVSHTEYDLLGRVTSSAAAYGTSDALTVSASYDSAGRLLDVTAPGSRTTRYGYDSWGRATSVTERYGTAFARTSTVALDDLGGALTVTDPLGTVTAFTANVRGQVTSVTAASGTTLARTASATFDVFGRTLTTADPRSFVTSYAYDDPNRAATMTDAAGYAWTTTFDKAGRVSTASDPFGNTTSVGYDLPGRVVSVTDPLSHTTLFQHNVAANQARTVDPLSHATSTTFDNFGRTASVLDPLGNTTAFGYDRDGNTTSVLDASGNVTSYTFDNLNRVTTETDPRGKSTTYAYTAAGDLGSITDRLGRVREFGYDAAGRRTSEVWKTGGTTVQTQTFGYDLLDRMTSATDPDGSYTLTYNALGQTTGVSGPFGVDLTFGYDAAGNRTSVTDNQGGSTTSTFDSMNRLSTRTQTATGMGTVRADWTYTKAGEVASVTRYSDAAGTVKVGGTAYSYDNARRLVGIDHTNATGTSVGAYTFGYDAADRLTGETFNGASKTYTYDAANQLTGDNGTAYSYDKTGNRTNSGYVTGTGNRTTSDGTWTYTYDDEGQMVAKSKSGEAWSYTYDHRGQMTSASKSATPGGTVTDSVSYKIDAWGNRIERGQSGGSTSTQRSVVDGWDTAKPGATGTENFDTVMDLDGSNAVTNRRVFGGGFDEAVARQDAGGGVTWYGQDQVGSVRQVFDNTGNVTGSRTYSAFGEITVSSGTGQDRYGYTGTVTDGLTGLVGDNARQYDPTLGQWTSEDPIGFAAGDTNLRRYVGNNATNGVDPTGLDVLPAASSSTGKTSTQALCGPLATLLFEQQEADRVFLDEVLGYEYEMRIVGKEKVYPEAVDTMRMLLDLKRLATGELKSKYIKVNVYYITKLQFEGEVDGVDDIPTQFARWVVTHRGGAIKNEPNTSGSLNLLLAHGMARKRVVGEPRKVSGESLTALEKVFRDKDAENLWMTDPKTKDIRKDKAPLMSYTGCYNGHYNDRVPFKKDDPELNWNGLLPNSMTDRGPVFMKDYFQKMNKPFAEMFRRIATAEITEEPLVINLFFGEQGGRKDQYLLIEEQEENGPKNEDIFGKTPERRLFQWNPKMPEKK